MTTPNETQQADLPIIPPAALLGVGAVGIIVAVIALASGAQGVITLGALAIGVISLIAWVVLNPDAAMDVVRGRNVTYGGTAIVVIVLALGAAIALYAVVAAQGISVDVSGRDVYSLNDNVGELVEQLAADPTTPNVRIVAFLTAAQSSERDRLTLLFDDFQEISDGKITYEFIDPNRSPTALEAYEANVGQIAVAIYDPETDTIDADSAELVAGNPQTGSLADQRLITDAIITLTASGDFRAYFLRLENGVSIANDSTGGAQVFATQLTERYRWTVEEISPLELRPAEDSNLALDADADAGVELNDPAADGEVLIIAGGQQALPDDVAQGVIDYLDAGGNVMIFGVQSALPDAVTPGAADNLGDYLQANFGVRLNNDLIIDPESLSQFGTLEVIATDFQPHPITEDFSAEQDAVLMLAPQSIDIRRPAPENVTVSPLLQLGENAYAKTGLDLSQQITSEDIQLTADDTTGPFVIAAAAENSATGARLVLFGAADPLYNEYVQFIGQGAVNFLLAEQSIFWATDYESVAGALADLPPIGNDADAPIFVQPGTTTTVNLVVLGLLPFGVLAVGVAVWYVRRERTRV